MRVRTSIGNRILSVLLAACLVFGMIPLSIFSVSAADSSDATTEASLEAIRSYASKLLNSNFSKTGSAPSWDTEGKSDTWRYYNGLMVDALLMLGVDSSAGNALEYAKDYLDANIESDGSITDWHADELDSVPPALALLDLLDTAEVDSATRADYVTAINYVYKELENQTSYDECGGNFLHKNSWTDWNIGLDGIYMAFPFLMEYAAALEAGKIENTVNSKTASDIYKEMHDRLMWIAEYMYDDSTGLYHHGWSVSDSEGNGHFWSRAIGWYAAGLVMCIDLMPEGQYKEDLIDQLPKLFDGMLQYQDEDTGLWYNVVNRDSSLTDNNGNKLETSGSALMAYAMVMAYNEGWVAESYATKGLEAFNGIVSEKLKDGKITDIYKSSGVCTDDASYCKNSYVSDEAKGVGGVLMAAAEVDRYLGNSEAFAAGVVVAPSDMTVAAGATTVDTSNIKVSLLGNQGNIANGVASQMNYEIGTASNGKATVSVYNGDALIGTFQVNVVDPSVPAEGEGTLGIETGEVTVPSNPSFSAGDFVLVKAASAGGSGSGSEYIRITSLDQLTSGANYVIAADGKKYTLNWTGSAWAAGDITGYDSANSETGYYTLGGTICHWQWDGSHWYTTVSGTDYYMYYTGTSGSNISATATAADATAFTATVTDGTFDFAGVISDKTRHLQVASSKAQHNSSAQKLAIFQQVAGGDPTPAVYAQLTGSQGFVYPFGVASGDIVDDIKASTDFKVLVSANADGSDYTEVAMSDSLVTVEKNSDYKNDEAKTNNFIVKYDGVQIGTIPVVVYDDSSSVTNYDVNFAVTPGAVVATVGDANKQLNVSSFTVGDLSGIGYSVKYSGGSSSVATVSEDGLVTIVGEGSTTITATVVAITYDGTTYDSGDFGSITATIPVVVNAEPVEVEVTYSITGLTILPSSVTAGDTAQATATAAASDGSGNHSYVFNYAITSGGSGASINSTTGAITTTAAGTYTVTATLAQVDGDGAFNKGTVTKTATFTVVAPASYEYTILGSNGSALSGQNITLNAGDTYTPSFTVKLGDQNVTSSYGMTLEATSNASAVSISGTTITANEVSTDTVVGIRATVAPFSRAAASGTSVDFTVTVLATEDEPSATGNISTGSGTGSVDSDPPSRDNTSSYVEIVAPTTTGGSNTTYGGYIDSSLPATDFFTFSGVGYKSGVTMSYNDVTTDGTMKMQSSTSITFDSSSAGAGTLLMVFDSSSAGKTIKVDSTTYTLAATDGLCILSVSLSAGSHTITRGSGESYLGYISYATTGSGSGGTTTVPGEYAKLDGTKGYAFPFNTASADIIAAIQADTSANALKIMIAEDENGTNAAALENGLNNSRVEITKNASGDTFQMDVANTYYFGVSLDGKKIGEIPVKIYDDTATGTTWYNGTLSLNPTSLNLTVGDDAVNIADSVSAVAVEGGAAATINSFTTTWESSNTNVATVDSNGNVTAVGPGTATITAKLSAVTVNDETGTIHEEIKATATVNVSAAAPDTYTVSFTNAEVNEKVDLDLAPLVTVKKNGSTVTSGYTLNYKIENTDQGTDSIFVGQEVTADDTFNVTISVIVDGETVATTTGTVTVKDVPSSGTGNIYTHNFSTDADGMTDADGYFTISGNTGSTGGTVDGVTYDQGLKLESSAGEVTFNAANAGTLTLHVNTGTSSVKIDGTNYTVTDGIVTVELAAGSHTISKGSSGGGPLYYIEFAEEGSGSTDPDEPTIESFTLGVTSVTISESDIDEDGYVSQDALIAAIRAASGLDKDTVTLSWTYSDGDTGSAELVVGAGQNIPLLVATHSNGARYLGVWYNELGYTGEIGVTVEAAPQPPVSSEKYIHNFTEHGFTDEDDFFTIAGSEKSGVNTISYNGQDLSKALKMNSSAKVSFTADANGELILVFADGANNLDVTVDGTTTRYTRDSNNVATVTGISAGDDVVIDYGSGEGRLYYVQFVPTGAVTVYPTGATVSPSTVNVANSGTVDLSGVTMEVTMSDGSKKTVQNSDLTYDVSGINTAIAGTYTVPVSYTESGKTVSANVSVVVAAASSGGGTTTSDLWKHNFDEDGLTDEDGFFTISGNVKTGIEGSYGDLTFDKGMKIESSTEISFTAPNEGTLTLVLDAASKDIKVNGTTYTSDSNGIVTVDVAAGSVEITKGDSVNIFYMEYAAAITDGIQITAPGTLYIAGSGGLTPTHNLQYTVKHGGETITSGYSIEWTALDSSIVTVADGVITGLKPGTTSVTAKVTMSDGTEYTATVPVTVAGPSVSATEEMELIFGESGKDSATISASVLAGGSSTSNFTLGYKSSDDTIATVDEYGNVTAQGAGTVTIYTYIKTVNGYTVYSGDGTTTQPPYYDSTVVTVIKKEVSHASLNSYDYVISAVSNADDDTNLINALTYKESITGEGGVTAEEGLVLTVEFNTGEKRVLHYDDPGLTVDYTGVDFSDASVQTALVIYEDPVSGEELFRDTIWVHIEAFDPSQYDGVITMEDGIHYVLDTDGINLNEEYVIVADNGELALKNPSATATGSSGATGAAVTLANGVLASKIGSGNLFGGAAVDYLTIGESDEQQAGWLLDTAVENVVGPDGVTRLQINASNLNRYLGAGESETQLIHANAAHVYLETVSQVDGEYRIVLGYGAGNAPYYLGYVDGVWTATTEPVSVYMYNKLVEMTDDYGINYTLAPTEISLPQGNEADPIVPTVVYNDDTIVPAGEYTIVWSSSDTSIATVDQNGVVTGVKPGEVEIYATLYDVYDMAVVCTTHNVPYITKVVNVTVSSSTATPTLIPDEMTIGAGSMPNLTKVNIVMYYGPNNSGNYAVPYDQLNFKLADATGVAADGTVMDHFDNTVVGTYEVPVAYAGDTYILTIHVVEDPYAGLEEADSIPGYPDAGSVRMNKTAEGVLDFTATGVTKIELTAAGVSTKSSVDVVLIVDVSNSMGWSIDWFEGMTEDELADANDYDKGPAGGASGTDKLDLAMETADHFADILLNVDGGDNTLTFVTFAGADRDHGGSSDHVDSVRTPMVGISDYSIAAQVFADTKFTNVRYLDGSEEAGEYTLTIGGYDDDGYGEASVSGSNRGNTNYDFAFGEAIDAVAQLKAKWEANNEGTYEESGRQIHVVFMTDGAPSHYNSKNANGSSDTLWSGDGKYSKPDGVSESSWLEYIENYNELATQLKSQIDGAYSVGFDMAHGGFGTYSYELGEMQRVLEGLAKNTVVPVTMANDEEELDSYLTTLARALAYAGTNAQVTDTIGGNFSLFTGVSMYSKDITEGGIMSEATLAAMQAMSFPITVNSYTLVTVSDLDKTMSVILNDGSTATVTVKEEHLGLRVNEAPEILEQITFSADGTEAYSSLKSGNIMSINSKGERVIDAETFTYTATLDTVMHEGVETTHAKDEMIKWKIGTITDKEVAMEYYAYLDGALDNPREAVAGVYATNEYAYAEYIDVYGKYVKRYYGVPQIAWGAGNVTVRFFLVNENGQYVNRAGVPFSNPANRIFLDGRAHYEAELNNLVSFTAQDALVQAGLAGNNTLYDVTAGATVTNSTTANQGGVVWSMNTGLNNIANLLTYTDSSNGYYTSVVIDIPVVMTDLGESLRPLAGETVVIDYGKPMDIDLFSAEEKPYVAGYPDVRNPDVDGTMYWYTMEIAGFAEYSSNFDQRDYVMAAGIKETLTTSNGTYTVTSANGDTQVRFTPSGIMTGMDQVFVVVAFREYYATPNGDGTYSKGALNPDGGYYMYKQLNVIPATIVYYETDGNVGGSFSYTGNWVLESVDGYTSKNQDVYTVGGTYGYDSSYLSDSTLSNGASQKAYGAGVANTTATFTFTGTGFDIISRTADDQGSIRVQVKDASGNVVKTISVINKGENELYQNPVISVELEEHDTYTVVIGVYPGVSYTDDPSSPLYSLNRGNEFYFDAVRIYGTMTGAETFSVASMNGTEYTTTKNTVESVYTADKEASPVFTEIRDILIDADSFASTGDGAMFMDDFGTGEVNVTNYQDWGANNETYLKKGQAIAFTFDLSVSSSCFDMGLRAVDGNTVKAKVAIVAGGTTYEKEMTLGSATAQFYDILAATGYTGTGTVHVVITATDGSGILCITDLKHNGSAISSSYQTYLAARTVLSGEYDVYSAVFADDSVRIARTTTMTVVTSTEVESLVITNCYGEEVWFSATSQDVGSQRIWTVKLRPVLQGEQSFTVTGVGADGTTGVSASDSINVKLY